ncbi:hypothetical protein AURDEDRAFT_174313 [Auricularia subglabra TFB-10046 SS5]|nr:hypothetical protein AURDEDRAFT_174313 [Auricularia subglabra TFB-10046 SS5]
MPASASSSAPKNVVDGSLSACVARASGDTSVPLPDELLREIFLQTTSTRLPTGVLAYRDMMTCNGRCILGGDAHRAIIPFHLAAVSRRWRRVALDTAELWTWISFGTHPHGGLAKYALYIQTLLSRSRYAALDIFIDVYSSVRDDSSAAADTVCNTIAGAASRWRFLRLRMPPPSDVAFISALLSCRAPELEALVVGHSGPHTRWFPSRRQRMGELALTLTSRKLRVIELSDLTLDAVVLESAATLRALVSLSLDNVRLRGADILWHMLDSARNLGTLCLVNIVCVGSDHTLWRPPPSARLRLPHLVQLEISCYNTETAELAVLAQWAAHLEVPRLESLDLTCVFAEELLALAPCVRASLRRLSYVCDSEPSGLAPVFAAVGPHVRALAFGPCGFIPEPALLQAMADGAVFPELEHVLFHGVELVWNPDPDDGEYDWIVEHADRARAAAQALLDLARVRNSMDRRDAVLAQGRRPPPRLELIEFEESELDGQFFRELQELVVVGWKIVYTV